jgi:serine/threonine-protein kinase RsbW
VPGALELLFEDTGRPFDPLSHAEELPPDLDAPPDERSVGGLGIHIVATLARGARYSREEGCNRLHLRLELGAGGVPDATRNRSA